MKMSEKYALMADAHECDAYAAELHLKYEDSPVLIKSYTTMKETFEQIARTYRALSVTYKRKEDAE